MSLRVKFKVKDGRNFNHHRSSPMGSQTSLKSALSSGRNTDSLKRDKRVRIITHHDREKFIGKISIGNLSHRHHFY